MPPTPVHGVDTYTKVEMIALQSAGEDPTYPDARWDQIGLSGETTKEEREAVAQVSEIVPSGATTLFETGPGRWRGTFTTLVYYNARWFHRLMCQWMGGLEILEQDDLPDGSAAPGAPAAVNTHLYLPQSFRNTAAGSISAVPFGLAFRFWKMGVENTGGTHVIEKVLNARVVECQIAQTAGDWLQATWTIEGDPPVELDGTGLTPVARTANEYFVKPGDLSRDSSHSILPSLAETGLIDAAVVTPGLEGFSVRGNNGLVWPRNLATAFDTTLTPGHGSNWSVGMEVRDTLSKDFGVIPNWGYLYESGASGYFRLRYISAPEGATHSINSPLADAAEDVPYAFEILIPEASFRDRNNGIPGPGRVADTYQLEAHIKAIGIDAGTTALASNYHGLVLFQFLTSNAAIGSGGDGDAKYNATTEGGNEPHATLVP